MTVEPERIVAAVERWALRGGTIERTRVGEDGVVTVLTDGPTIIATPAGWDLGAGETVLLRTDTWTDYADVVYGVLFEPDGAMRLLNERATMDDLGRRLGADLDPIVYARVVAALYSGAELDAPVARAVAFGFSWPAGELVRRDPVVERAGDRIRIHFLSGRGSPEGCHIYRWMITGGGGTTPAWERDYVGFDESGV